MVRLTTILFLLVSFAAFGTVNAPTDFRTDPADFSNLALPVGAVQYQFRWTDNADNEVRYEMEVSTDGVNFVYEGYRAANATGYDTANVPWTSNRWYRLRAVSATEASTYAGPIKCYGYMPPTNLGGSTAATNLMTITWSTAGGMIDGYTVQQATNTAFDGELVEYYVAGIDSASYTITNAFTLNAVYYFRVVSTNSAVGNGNSEAMNKPISYIACAPNGPPVAPTLSAEYTTANAGEAFIVFNEVALNGTGWILQYSNSVTPWTEIAIAPSGVSQQTVYHTSMTAGSLYHYRLASTNSLGLSPYTEWTFTPPATPSAGWTVWYVDGAATGNNTGTNWANAWQSIGAINWPVLGLGHTVYIAGGNYTNSLVTFADGAYGNPILIKSATETGHNSRVKLYGGVYWKSSYVTIDGSIDPSATPALAESVPANINWEVIGDGSANSVMRPVKCIGAVGKWMELHGAGSPVSGEGDGNGLDAEPTITQPTNSVFAYLWIHDCYGHIILQGKGDAAAPSASSMTFHHILGENCHNNFIMGQGWYDMHDCLLRNWKGPAIAHPDGFQGGIQDVRMWNNRFINSCPSGTTLYPDLSGSTANFYLVNNLFAGMDTPCSFALQAGDTSEMVLSNVVVVGNTFYGSNSVYFSLSVNGGLTNRILKAWRVENNLFYSGAGSTVGAASFSPGNTRYAESDVIFDFNVLCGPQKLFYYRTNADDINGSFLFTPEQFNGWSSLYKSNSSAQVVLLREALQNYSLYGGDTNAIDHGTNLTALAATVPGITNDAIGSVRGIGNDWDIGAYEHDSSLVLYYDFEGYTNGPGSWVQDMSGHGNHALTVTNRTVTDVGNTNYAPGVVLGKVGAVAANFMLLGTNEQWQVYHADLGYQIGTWFGITNWNGIDFLTNGTFAVWANYTNAEGFGDATLWGGGWINSPPDDNTWDISRYDADNQTMTLFNGGTRTKPVPFPNPAAGEWQHIAVTWNATNHTVVGYTNGVAFLTNTFTMPYLHLADSGVHNVIIGASTHGGSWTLGSGWPVTPDDQFPNNGWFTGWLDEMRVYNRDLSAAEVAGIYSGSGVALTGGGGGAPPEGNSTTIRATISRGVWSKARFN